MKKFLSLSVVMIMLVSLLAGCGTKKTSNNTNPTSTTPKVKIGMSTDQGGLGDKSFNDAAYLGLQNIQKTYGIKPDVLQSKQQENYEPNLTQLCQQDDLTFAIGYMMADALKNVSTANPNKKFCIIDDSSITNSNVLSITFTENESSYLMGIIAGKMTKTGKIGFIGGMDGALIQKFEAGFIAGVKSVNPDAAKDLENRKNVRYAASFSDSNKGYELAEALYNSGCDVIYHASGAVGLGLFKATKELRDSGKNVWAIGVDQDQAVSVTDSNGQPIYAKYILSSAIKRVDTATYMASEELIKGTWKGGHIVLGLKEQGVGMADSTSVNTPSDVVALAKQYQQAIIDGKIIVPATLADEKTFKAPTL